MERTEEQKVAQVPVTVVFGGKQYELKPLVWKKSTPWRRKFIEAINETSGLSKILSDNPEEFSHAMLKVLLDKPEQMAELFFDYAENLNREEIENSATSKEILAALEEVVAFEAPFFGASLRVMTIMKRDIIQ
jgi:hypothetical protein